MSTEIAKALTSRAEEKFGKERAEQLRVDIEQTAADIEKVRAAHVEPVETVEIDDEP